MNNDEFRTLVDHSPFAFAHHKMITDPSGAPEDYIFIYVNEAFEAMTGLSKEKILNQRVTQVLPGISASGFDWINTYWNVAKNGGSVDFRQHSEPLNRWYEVTAFSDREGYFSTVFRDVTKDEQEKALLEELVRISEDSLRDFGTAGMINNFTDTAKRISGAKFVAFNLYNRAGTEFSTVSIAGLKKGASKIISALGYDPLDHGWKHDERRANAIAGKKITEFQNLTELTGTVIPEMIIRSLARIFGIGKVFISKIMKDDIMLGDFTFFMKSGEDLENSNFIEILSGYAGLYLERQSIQKDLINKTEELEDFFNVNLDLLCIADTDGRFIRLNRSWEDILGYSTEELAGRKFLDFVHPDDVTSTMETVARLENQEKITNFTNRYKAADGSYRWIEWRSNPKGRLIYAAARDITERKKMLDDLQESSRKFSELAEQSHLEQERFRATLLSVGDAVIAADDSGRITIMNDVAEYLTGWTPEEAEGRIMHEVFEIADEITGISCDDPLREVLLTGQTVELGDHSILKKRNGDMIPVEVSSSPIRGKDGFIAGVVTVFRDYTEKREKQREVEYLSFHDYLTGLYNRRYFEDALKRLDSAVNMPFTVFVVDVNGLKLINDSYGHDMGDMVLKKAAGILKKCCREDAIISRIGGDEFTVLHPQTDKEAAEKMKEHILRSAEGSDLETVIVSLAVGFAVKDSVDTDIANIIKDADARMYKDKAGSSRTIRSEMIKRIIRHLNERYDSEKKHTEMVSWYCEKTAAAMGLNNSEVSAVRTAGIFHDIGKIRLAPEILNKRGTLTPEEWKLVRYHSVAGYSILKNAEEYTGIAETVLYHHERWDGKGYPKGLKGEKIPLYSRMIAVADAFEAMTSDRPYRRTLTESEAVSELIKFAGTQFDPQIVDIFIRKVLKRKARP